MYVAILGRQPEISLVELNSLYGDAIYLNDEAAILSQKPYIKRLGGTQKIGEVLFRGEINDVAVLKGELVELALQTTKTKKLSFGVSLYGEHASTQLAHELSGYLKSKLTKSGINARAVPQKSAQLNTAQVWHNKLDTRGLELLVVFSGSEVVIGKTINVQNADSYTKRDRMKPRRDMQVGMLPPKLAQIILNLALGTRSPRETLLLDPFCGLGTILMEAQLMGTSVYGSDIAESMVAASTQNMDWLNETYRIPRDFKIELGDATSHRWSQFDTVACEFYLGPPLHKEPSSNLLEELMKNGQNLLDATLENLSQQMKTTQRMCLALPAWKINNTFHTLNVDSLEKFGYNQLRFNTKDEDLIYARDDAFVGRHLIVATKE